MSTESVNKGLVLQAVKLARFQQAFINFADVQEFQDFLKIF